MDMRRTHATPATDPTGVPGKRPNAATASNPNTVLAPSPTGIPTAFVTPHAGSGAGPRGRVKRGGD